MSSDGPRAGTCRHADREHGKRANDQARSGRPLKFYTTQDVANMLGVSERSVRRWTARGELAVHRFGGVVRIAEVDLKLFLARHRED